MRIITFFLLFLFVSAAALTDGRKANEAYNRGDYREAVELYRQAIEQDPENARLHFNLGKSLYELGQIEEAMEAYNRYKNIAETSADQSLADYNQGRMLADQEMYDEALNYFREALINNPEDEDARFNYELARRMIQQQEQQDQQQPEDQEQGDDVQQNDRQQDNQQDQNQDPDSGQSPPQQQEGTAEQEPRPQTMTREEAENILDALEQLERELLENQKKESSETQSRNEKDW